MKHTKIYDTSAQYDASIETDYVEPFLAYVKDSSTLMYNKYKNSGIPYVDMGYGQLWATYDIGASAPEEEGLYCYWAATRYYNEDSGTFVWDAYDSSAYSYIYDCPYVYDYYDKDESTWKTWFKKYTGGGIKGISYAVMDNLYSLRPEDNIARLYLGGEWDMPTYNDVYALYETTNMSYETINGVECVKLTSTINGNSLYFRKTELFWTKDLGQENSPFTAYAYGYCAVPPLSSSNDVSSNILKSAYDSSNNTYFGAKDTNRYAFCHVRGVIGHAPEVEPQ